MGISCLILPVCVFYRFFGNNFGNKQLFRLSCATCQACTIHDLQSVKVIFLSHFKPFGIVARGVLGLILPRKIEEQLNVIFSYVIRYYLDILRKSVSANPISDCKKKKKDKSNI